MSELTMNKAKGQINIVLNSKTVNHLVKEERNDWLDGEEHQALRNIQKELDQLIGLDHVKKSSRKFTPGCTSTGCARRTA